MANNQYVNTDKYGNPYQVISCKPKKKNPDFNQGWIELQGKLYKLEVSNADKDGVDYWVRVTQQKKDRTSNKM